MPVHTDTPGSSTEELALFPLNTVLFPGGPLALRIFEPRYVDMVRECLRGQHGFGVVLIRGGSEIGPAQFEAIGTLARIVDFHALADGLLGLTTLGERRFRVRTHERRRDGLHVGQVQWLATEAPQPLPPEHQHLPAVLETLLGEASGQYAHLERRPGDASWVSCRLAELLPLTLPSRQFCLELDDPLQRLSLLSALIKSPVD
jgi:Lon protease-like protein